MITGKNNGQLTFSLINAFDDKVRLLKRLEERLKNITLHGWRPP